MTILEAIGKRPRVAVIGSGLAGLATAYLLRKEGCEVYIVEKVRSTGTAVWKLVYGAPADG